MIQTQGASREFYLIRHAQTDINVRPDLVGGRSPQARLTEKGRRQAKRLGRALLRAGILPTSVHSSPALRCLETARLSLAELAVTGEPEVAEALQELGQGTAEGRLRTDIYTPETLAEIGRQGKDFALPGGESMN